MNRLACVGVLAIIFWPVWLWFGQRLFDKSDDPLGILAILTLVALMLMRRDARNARAKLAAAPPLAVILMCIYAASYPWAPKLVHCLLAVAVLGIFLHSYGGVFRLRLGDWLLLFLSVPLVASLNFYAGYPLRLLLAFIAAPLISITGYPVVASGTALLWHGTAVEIDAPCSGVRQSWFSLYLAATFSSMFGLSNSQSALLVAWSGFAALLANVLRITSLFYIESGVINIADPTLHYYVHQGVGGVSFLIVGALILLYAAKLKGHPQGAGRETTGGAKATGAAAAPATVSVAGKAESPDAIPAAGPLTASVPGAITVAPDSSIVGTAGAAATTACRRLSRQLLKNWGAFGFACVAALMIPFVPLPSSMVASSSSSSVEFSGWPDTLDSEPLTKLPVTEVNERFLTDFPGKMALFKQGERTVIMRWIEHPTRQLHPSSDCYRGLGYSINWLPLQTYVHDGRASRWSEYEVRKDNETLKVRESLRDEHGNSWSDVSSWYWAAMLKRTEAPWWATTVIENVGAKSR
ncbi:MAG TPA: archaeosortase/exosortase family protein [Candidatus Obscuribacterales bacterium]